MLGLCSLLIERATERCTAGVPCITGGPCGASHRHRRLCPRVPNQCTFLGVFLQYVMGQFEQAAATVEKSLKTVRTNFEGAEDSLLTVKHRCVLRWHIGKGAGAVLAVKHVWRQRACC